MTSQRSLVQIQYRPPYGRTMRIRSEVDQKDIVTVTQDEASTSSGSIDASELSALIAEAVPDDAGLTPLTGFKMDLSANRGFLKVFFSARCDCGTVGMLSVEVAPDKTREEVDQALPSLVSKLQAQAQSFRSMSCEIHRKMRLGPAAGRK